MYSNGKSAALNWFALLALIATFGFAQNGFAGASYITNSDNENNAGTGAADSDMDVTLGRSSPIAPIEFNINVSGALPTTSAYLTIRANDIDEESGEVDVVYLNGVQLGHMSGVNNLDSTSAFSVPLNAIQAGNNKVTVDIDTSGDPTAWTLNVDWGQLVIDGGSADHADTKRVSITSFNIASGTVTMNVSATVEVATTGNYRLEVNLIDPSGNSSSALAQDFAATAGTTVVRSFSPTYPLSGGSGNYTIQAQLFYVSGGVPLQQDIQEVVFTHTQNVGPQLPIDVATSTISSAFSTLTANGTATTTITLQAKDGGDSNLTHGGSTVVLSTTVGTIGSVTDNGDGTYTATLTAPVAVGTATVSGTIDGASVTDTATVSFVAGAAAVGTSTVSSTASSLTANGSSSTTVTVQLIDTNGNNLTTGGATVVINSSLGSVGGVTDNGDGTYTATFTSGTTSGAATISAAVGGSAITDTSTITLNPGVASPATSTVSSATSSLTANGSSATTVTVQLLDSNGNQLNTGGSTVVISTNLGSLGSVTDNGNGTYSATFTSATSTGTATISATVGGSAITDTASISLVSGAPATTTSIVSSTASTLIANGSSTTTVTVQLVDANGNNVTTGGATVVINSSLGNVGSVTDNGNGTYTATFTSGTTAGSATISATLNGSPIGDTATIAQTAGPAVASSSTVSSTASTLIANGSSTTTVTVQLVDANGNNVTTGGATVAINSSLGSVGSVTDNGNGTYTATFTSGTTAGSATISATLNGGPMSDTATIAQTAGATDAANSVLDASPSALVADGSTTSVITVQLRDANGNARNSGGDTVVLLVDVGSIGVVSDNGDGTYSATYTSPATIGGASVAAHITSSINASGGPSGTITLTQDPDGDDDHDGISNAIEGTTDTDGDGIADSLDGDSDNDGIPDAIESTVDTDNDGVMDFRDRDSDGDGIPDALETGLDLVDSDLDGIVDALDVDMTGGTDANSDGVDDAAAIRDGDNDGIPDYLDRDSDNDGRPDALEHSPLGVDTDNDGIDAAYDVDEVGGTDANGDGIDDSVMLADFDGDGTPDAYDTDSDNDSILDSTENASTGTDDDGDGIDNTFDADTTGNVDTNGDGVADNAISPDNDGDGAPDYLDVDSDNDGIPDLLEGSADTDSDGIPDFRDTDSDGDSVDDSVEAGVTGIDSDNDGIDDRFDVDITAGTDANSDGIDDNVVAADTDSDGLADYLDPDSDNDGISDAVETGVDTDSDGIPDFRDLDSDGDGFPDATEGTNDSDGDGITDNVDSSIDEDHDGISDRFEGNADTDADGIVDALDRDSDNDGIPDAIEGTADIDGDGIPNYRDPDSDGDGVGDQDESGFVMTDSDSDGIVDQFDVDSTAGVDANQDGVDDAAALRDTDHDGVVDMLDLDSDNDGLLDVIEAGLVDANGDGLADAGQAVVNAPIDTDGDGMPDLRDVDSDSNGQFDLAPGLASLDTNNDGVIDPGTDADHDGVDDRIDSLPGSNGSAPPDLGDPDGDGIASQIDSDDDGDGVADSVEGTVDTDSDGISDSLDTDSDNDGYPDSVENGDYNNDGIPDRLTQGNRVETAVRGSGSVETSLLVLLGVAILLRRRGGFGRSVGIVATLLASLGANASELACSKDGDYGFLTKGCWYVGAGIGLSRLYPYTDHTDWKIDDEYDVGFKGTVGVQFMPHYFGEIHYADMGEAALKNRNPNISDSPTIHYRVPSLMGGFLLFESGARWNLFAKAGVAMLDTTSGSKANRKEDTSAQLALAAGVQWRFRENWFVRAELDNYDTDARALGVYVNRYFGGVESSPVRQAPQPAAAPLVRAVEPVPVIAAVVAAPDCRRFTGTLQGVGFESGSATIKPEAKFLLDAVVQSLAEFPDLKVEISAHTDNKGSEVFNQNLSQKRADAVVVYLTAHGIAASRLKARGYGESKPIADNGAEQGRAQNRRVEVAPLDGNQCVSGSAQ